MFGAPSIVVWRPGIGQAQEIYDPLPGQCVVTPCFGIWNPLLKRPETRGQRPTCPRVMDEPRRLLGHTPGIEVISNHHGTYVAPLRVTRTCPGTITLPRFMRFARSAIRVDGESNAFLAKKGIHDVKVIGRLIEHVDRDHEGKIKISVLLPFRVDGRTKRLVAPRPATRHTTPQWSNPCLAPVLRRLGDWGEEQAPALMLPLERRQTVEPKFLQPFSQFVWVECRQPLVKVVAQARARRWRLGAPRTRMWRKKLGESRPLSVS